MITQKLTTTMIKKIQTILIKAVSGTKEIPDATEDLLSLLNVDNVSPEQICKREGHKMYKVYALNNFDRGGSSHWGLNKCSRCGFEDHWQYDFKQNKCKQKIYS